VKNIEPAFSFACSLFAFSLCTHVKFSVMCSPATTLCKVLGLRNMISVSYFEKALYELPEDQLTSEAVTSLADKVEREIQGGLSGRPLLTVPHLISDEVREMSYCSGFA